ncbi:MAG: peptidoglycan recognition protein family protein [Nitrososphaera sp.]|nr:peptidoglycan recognition protein family protein [Nitrososphaera sp.]
MDNEEPINKPEKIIVHHTAAVLPNPQFNAIDEWHRQRSFPKSLLGFYVGYHYVIEKDGTVKQARGDGEIGAHTIGHNLTSIGIAMVGDFGKEMPTKEQIKELGNLLIQLTKKHSIHPLNIFPHKAMSATSCPGGKLDTSWPVLAYLTAEKPAIHKTIRKMIDI